jgi:4-amino-4-deoxy-L-arabinose transferase-like glycosyltransferase
VPSSLNWDEVAAGYNAFTIANWGEDEYGNKFPLVFRSFGDDKHPVHIYITAFFVKIFGLNEFTTRFPSALFGTLTVVAIYFLIKLMFKNELAGILSALFLAISPYHLQFSRGLWEITFAVFFYILALLLFYLGIKKKSWLLPLSCFSFGISFFSYHSSKVMVPPTILLLSVLYFKDIIKNKTALIFSGLVILLFTGLTIHDPRILGFARIEQNQIPQSELDATVLYKKTHNQYLAMVEVTLNHYKTYFYPSYLFVTGDSNPRNAVQNFGEFYKVDAFLVLAGIVYLIWKRPREGLVLALWLVLAPIAAAFAGGPQNAIRAGFMMGGVNILAALGASGFISFIKNKIWYVVAGLIILVPLFTEFGMYLKYYYTEYSNKYAIEWQYGMKQIVEYLKANPNYIQVYMDNIRQQPYIFFLYYFKTPLPDLLNTVHYDDSRSKSYNTVVSFGEYQFGGNWNIIDSYPNDDVLYIMTPSYYGGLRYISQFDVKDLIKYPNDANAFYIVEAKQ